MPKMTEHVDCLYVVFKYVSKIILIKTDGTEGRNKINFLIRFRCRILPTDVFFNIKNLC